jgi:hypothetical protein
MHESYDRIPLRRYCWRVGVCVETAEGDRCPECGSRDHRPVPRQNECANYVAVTELWGAPCRLPVGHSGICSSTAKDKEEKNDG